MGLNAICSVACGIEYDRIRNTWYVFVMEMPNSAKNYHEIRRAHVGIVFTEIHDHANS